MTKRLTLRRKLAPRVEPPAPPPAPPMEGEYYQRCENTRPEPPPLRQVREDGRDDDEGYWDYVPGFPWLSLAILAIGVWAIFFY